MRLPTVRKIFNTRRMLKGVMWQAAGVVLYAAGNKFLPNKWLRWGAWLIASGTGVWYPLTQEALKTLNLDHQIEATFS